MLSRMSFQHQGDKSCQRGQLLLQPSNRGSGYCHQQHSYLPASRLLQPAVAAKVSTTHQVLLVLATLHQSQPHRKVDTTCQEYLASYPTCHHRSLSSSSHSSNNCSSSRLHPLYNSRSSPRLHPLNSSSCLSNQSVLGGVPP